jgi:tRNA(Met) cytidine acetyltransferase
VVSVALLAREGGLDHATRTAVYEGERIRGNMLPDVLMSQLRDEDAGEPVGLRVMRIATHHEVRSRGLGSRLLREIREEFASTVDWLGVGFGATPELVDFWQDNGYGTIHLATTRNETSGEYSVLLLDPTSERGEELHATHSRWFAARIIDVLGDALRDMDPDVVRAALAACDERSPLHLGDREWRLVTAASFGPALYSVDPAPFRELAMHYFTRSPDLGLTAREERLLVEKLLQLRPWDAVAADLEYVSTAEAMRSLGAALQPLVAEFGPLAALEEADRYRT